MFYNILQQPQPTPQLQPHPNPNNNNNNIIFLIINSNNVRKITLCRLLIVGPECLMHKNVFKKIFQVKTIHC
jgi:hypothetical protein